MKNRPVKNIKNLDTFRPDMIYLGDCRDRLQQLPANQIGLTFMDPPFNQGQEYAKHDDAMEDEKYGRMMRDVCQHIYACTTAGGAIYFMQREKMLNL